MSLTKPIIIINVISQLGAGRRASGEKWYKRIIPLVAQLEMSGVQVADIFTVKEPDRVTESDPQLRYLDEVMAVCSEVYKATQSILDRKFTPVILGGDHSVAIGSVTAASHHCRMARSKLLNLIWADAHIDMNTAETTPSGNIHGMTLAALCGMGHPVLTRLSPSMAPVLPDNLCCIGLRYADRSEIPNLDKIGIRPHTTREVDEKGISAILDDCFGNQLIAGPLHFSLDLDVLDPPSAPAVNTPFPGGMSFRESEVSATGFPKAECL